MEPFGVVASSLAVVHGIRKTAQTLKRLKNAPRELRDLLEQVEDLTTVLDVVSEALRVDDVPQSLQNLLERLKHKLLDLEKLIHFKLVKPAVHLEVDRLAWTRHADEISRKVEGVQKTLNSVSTMLTALSFLRVSQVPKHISSLSITSRSCIESSEGTSSLMLGKVDGLATLCKRTASSTITLQQIEAAHDTVRHSEDPAPLSPLPTDKSSRAGAPQHSASGTVHVSLDHYTTGPTTSRLYATPPEYCPKSCKCRCHKRKTITLPHSLRWWIGSLHFTTANTQLTLGQCTIRACRRRANCVASLHYTFPPWMTATTIAAWYRHTTAGSIERVVRIVRVVDTDAFYYARVGDLESLREMYKAGAASIYDAHPILGDTTLSIAVRYHMFDVVRFLLAERADPMQQNFVGADAQSFALQRYFDPSQSDRSAELCNLFAIHSIMEDEEMTILHGIILGRSNRDLESELSEHPEFVDVPDSQGRTPLHWAFTRQDLQALRILLQSGADISAVTKDGVNVFQMIASYINAAEIFDFICMRGLEARWPTRLFSSCLNMLNAYGMCAWHYAIKSSQSNLLKSFLEYGADLSVKTSDRQSLFHIAVMYAEAEMLCSLVTVSLQGVDYLATDMVGDTAMELLLDRLEDDMSWTAPAYSEEDAEALVRLVTHARTFEPRLPQLVYGFRIGEEGVEPHYGLWRLNTGFDIADKWANWVDVENWLEKHGRLDMAESWMVDLGDEQTYYDATDEISLQIISLGGSPE